MASICISPKINVVHCFECQGDTEYHCLTCEHNLCPQCKRKHEIGLDTKQHNITRFMCKNTKQAYARKHKKYKKTVNFIRSETLYTAEILLADVKRDVKTCQKEIIDHQSEMVTKSQRVKDLLDTVIINTYLDYKFLLKKKLWSQLKNMKKNLSRIEKYEQRHEQSANRPVQFLCFIKKTHLPQMQDIPPLPRHFLFSLIQEINIDNLIKNLSEIIITQRGKRRARNDHLLRLLPSPVLQKSCTVKDIYQCQHITSVTRDCVWVSDINDLILTDISTGDTLQSLDNSLQMVWSGIHTINSDFEMIYVSDNNEINKLSSDGETTKTWLKIKDTTWEPRCLYSSTSTGDLLIGLYKFDKDTEKGKVMRYSAEKSLQTIQHDFKRHTLYKDPCYITQNNNGDIVVSDYWCGVVVTTRCGRHRFSYKGAPSGFRLQPRGICTDALSNILVCDRITDTIHILDKNGGFMSYLLTKILGLLGKPCSLSYDFNTHLLWVGSWDNTLSVYRHIERHLASTDNSEYFMDRGHDSSGVLIPFLGQSFLQWNYNTAMSMMKNASEIIGDMVETAKMRSANAESNPASKESLKTVKPFSIPGKRNKATAVETELSVAKALLEDTAKRMTQTIALVEVTFPEIVLLESEMVRLLMKLFTVEFESGLFDALEEAMAVPEVQSKMKTAGDVVLAKFHEKIMESYEKSIASLGENGVLVRQMTGFLTNAVALSSFSILKSEGKEQKIEEEDVD